MNSGLGISLTKFISPFLIHGGKEGILLEFPEWINLHFIKEFILNSHEKEFQMNSGLGISFFNNFPILFEWKEFFLNWRNNSFWIPNFGSGRYLPLLPWIERSIIMQSRMKRHKCLHHIFGHLVLFPWLAWNFLCESKKILNFLTFWVGRETVKKEFYWRSLIYIPAVGKDCLMQYLISSIHLCAMTNEKLANIKKTLQSSTM